MRLAWAAQPFADVARRHDVTRPHIYQWRQQLKGKGLWAEPEGAAFLAIDAPEISLVSGLERSGSVQAEISFANGRTLRCPAGMAQADILRLIRLVETA